jgi:large subunit ribosomal protein L18
MKLSKNQSRVHRKRRIRAKVSGTKECPRLAVFKSLKSVYVQVIDDAAGKTLVSGRLSETKLKNDVKGAEKLGEIVAKKCQDAKIEKVVFDRAGWRYHGKIKALAEGARRGGLKF